MSDDRITYDLGDDHRRYPRLRKFERFTATRVTVLEGRGVEGSIARLVVYVYDEDGDLIARNDPCSDDFT